MASTIDDRLSSYHAKNMTMRVCQALLHSLPHTEALPEAKNMDELLQQIAPDAPPEVMARARQLAHGDAARTALRLFTGLDAGDSVITIWSSACTAVKLWLGRKKEGSPSDAESEQRQGERMAEVRSFWDQKQAEDAVLKAMVLNYVIVTMLPLEPRHRLSALMRTAGGRALLATCGAVDIALPFLDQGPSLDEGPRVRQVLSKMTEEHADGQAKRLRSLLDKRAVDQAQDGLHLLVGCLDLLAEHAAGHLGPVAQSIGDRVPLVGSLTEGLADVAAAGADVLPLYRCLGSRFVAEAAIWLALHEADHPRSKQEHESWIESFLPEEKPEPLPEESATPELGVQGMLPDGEPMDELPLAEEPAGQPADLPQPPPPGRHTMPLVQKQAAQEHAGQACDQPLAVKQAAPASAQERPTPVGAAPAAPVPRAAEPAPPQAQPAVAPQPAAPAPAAPAPRAAPKPSAPSPARPTPSAAPKPKPAPRPSAPAPSPRPAPRPAPTVKTGGGGRGLKIMLALGLLALLGLGCGVVGVFVAYPYLEEISSSSSSSKSKSSSGSSSGSKSKKGKSGSKGRRR